MRLAIDDGNLFGVGKVYKNAGARRFQLERLRVRSELEFLIETLVGCCVDHPNCCCLAVAVADVDALVSRIVAQVVSISVKVNARDEIEGGSVVYVNLAFGTRYEQLVSFQANTPRLVESAPPLCYGRPSGH